MTIKELITSNLYDVQVSHGFRWLIGNKESFTVYERPLYAKRTKMLYEGNDEEMAVKFLIKRG